MSILDSITSAVFGRVLPPNIPGVTPDSTHSIRRPATRESIDTATTTTPSNVFQSLYVLFNPRARHGRIQHEAGPLQAALGRITRLFSFEMTNGPSPADRREQVQRAVAERMANGQALEMSVIGGDGTVVPAIQAAVERILGRSLTEISLQEGPTATASVWSMIHGISFFSLGTAADLAKQNGAPPSLLYPARYGIYEFINRHLPSLGLRPPSALAAVPSFLDHSVRVPLSLPVVTIPDREPMVTTEAFGIGMDAEMFFEGERRRAGNSQLRGLGLFVAALRDIIPRRLRANWSFEAKLELNGRELPMAKGLGGMIITPNTYLGGLGALPGPWGSVKVLMIPASFRGGVLAIFEAVARRALNNIGVDTLSLAQRLRILNPENCLLLQPGDRLKIQVQHNDTNEAPGLIAQTNGDALLEGQEALRVHEAEVYVPPVTVPSRAAPNSVSAQQHSIAALRRGDFIQRPENPHSPEYRASLGELPVGRFLASCPSPHSNGVQRQTTTFYPADSLHRLASDHNIQNSELPRVIAEAHQNNFDHPLSMTEVEQWAESDAGRARLQILNPIVADRLANRARTQGGSLVVGLLSCLGVNHLLQRFGIDEEHNPLLHFSLSTLAGHVAQKFTRALAIPVINTWRGLPYHRATLQAFNAEGIAVSRVVYSRAPTLFQAMRLSVAESFGLGLSEARVGNLLIRSAASTAGLMSRTILSMGPGLMTSRLTDYLLEHHTSLDANTRSLISSAAFFAPSIASILFGNPACRLFASPLVVGAGFVFSAGFTADLIYRSVHGHSRQTQLSSHSPHSLGQGLLTLVCPEIAAAMAA
ncbi:MAG: hypothetical protein HQM15_11910 [Deltaproteobacteria bacterium]|nr:hypothetical protein [Deltaproteobacteria bacterium]